MKQHYQNEQEVMLHVQEDGYYPIYIDANKTLDLNIMVDKHISASIFITYHGVDVDCNCHITASEDSHCQILFWNEVTTSLNLQQNIVVLRNANLTIGEGDVTSAIANVHMKATLVEEGAKLHVLHTCMSAQKKHYQLKCIHEVAHTESNMENYCVVKEHGDYFMEATGQIKKGAYESTSLQTTRVLTMSKNQKSEVIPLLLIDENDVKAGHATTVGQPDENQLYYLQTRGLNRNQAIALLIIGYMMPIIEVIDQEDVKTQLQITIEERVGYYA